jgi:hypothetical protein
VTEPGTRVWAVRNADQETVWAFGFGVYAGDFPRPGGASDTDRVAAEKAIQHFDAMPLPPDDPKAAAWLAADRVKPMAQRVNELVHEMSLNPKIVLDDGGVVWGYECWWGEAADSTPQEWAAGRRIVVVPAPAVLAARKRHGQVSRLPRRVAEVAHALMEACTQIGGGVPVTTHEVWERDSRSLTLGSTSSALTRAMRLRLADRAAPRGLWMPTNQAWELRRALEDRVLGKEEVDEA